MTYLLDVSTLMALLWRTHVHHQRVMTWQAKEKLAVCPLSELGFLRISTQPSFGLSVEQARKVLKDWRAARDPIFVACDMEALESDAPTAGTRTTDFYLASLAQKHDMELATLDAGIGHIAGFLVPV